MGALTLEVTAGHPDGVAFLVDGQKHRLVSFQCVLDYSYLTFLRTFTSLNFLGEAPLI